ncbi:MAG: polysaccharide deacetylase family protein [Clostridia bacterium]|nr:polysaccharide deacetylase family protein [Clostridia bacterium]
MGGGAVAEVSQPKVISQEKNSTVNGKDLPIYCVQTDKKQIALSFDAAWGAEDSQKILDILDKHNVKVTFFMTGGWVEDYPDVVKEIRARGHDLGNHSENHKQMSKLSVEQNKEEIQKVHDKVKALTDYDMFLFRPPYGDYDSELIRTVYDMGYYPIQWSVDSLDWKDYGVDSIIKKVVDNKNLDSGAIILCHNGAKYTADALDSMITALKDKGYEFVPISELIIKDNFHMDVTGKQIGD